MEDIIQKYKKERKIKNIYLVVFSLFLAIWLNFMFSNNYSGSFILWNVNSKITWNESADLYITKIKDNIVNIKSSKSMENVKSISFSIAYNSKNIDIKDKEILLKGWEKIDLINNDWYNTLILNFKNPINISQNEDIFQIVFDKKDFSKLESINLINSNIIDKDNNNYLLSTSWIEI